MCVKRAAVPAVSIHLMHYDDIACSPFWWQSDIWLIDSLDSLDNIDEH
jgi:hypothetical protein